jgi:ABC-type transport system substrate-binding protein
MKTLIPMQNVLIAVALGSFSPGFAAELPVMGGALRLGAKTDIAALNPFVGTFGIDHNARSLVFEPLLMGDKNLQIRPYLAESWEISGDGRVYTFHLRKGVKFHNGKEMQAEDVKWSIDHVLDRRNGAYGRPDLGLIERSEVVDAHRVRVTLNEPRVAFLAVLTGIPSLLIVPKDSLKGAERPQAYPPGTGPYRFVEWSPGKQLVFQKHAAYWQKGIPHIDQIIMRTLVDDEVRVTSLRSGDLDFIERVPPQYVARIQKGEFKDIQLFLTEAGTLGSFIFNVKRPPFDNVKVRQAVAYAIDKEEILKGAYSGVGKVADQIGIPGYPWFFEVPGRKRDLRKARQLLQEAGYPNGFSAKAYTTPGSTDFLYIAQSQLREIGIQLEAEVLDLSTHMAKQKKGDFAIAVAGGTSPWMDADLNYYPFFHSEQGAERFRNTPGFSNPRADELLDQGRVATDPKLRQRIYREFVELLLEEVPMLFVAMRPYIFSYREHVKDVRIEPRGRFFSGDLGLPLAWLEAR